MISYKDFSNLCNKYKFVKVRCTAGVDFVGFYLENHSTFYTIGMYTVVIVGYTMILVLTTILMNTKELCVIV